MTFASKSLIVLVAFIAAATASRVGLAADENWPRFRGVDGSGLSDLKGLPTTWSPGEYAWNIEIPGVGHASPIVWRDKLFVSSALEEGLVRQLHCIHTETGEFLWSRSTGMNTNTKHLKSSWASGSAVTDGERVYVPFADREDFLLAAYDLDGNLEWRRNFGPFDSDHGHGASPIIYQEMLIVTNDQQGPSSILAVDRKTGRTLWTTMRAMGMPAYATPLIVSRQGAPPQLICASSESGVASIDPANGALNWRTGPFKERVVSSPLLADGLVVQTTGGGGVGRLLVVLDPFDAPQKSESEIDAHLVYKREKALPYVPTPIAYDGHLYLWNDNGTVCCVETQSGDNVWTKRVGGNFSGSPICVDGKLYIISEAGEVVVMDASPDYRLYGKSDLADPSHATPAVGDGRLFLRTFHRLACIEAKP
jgi:outer membrane protein assembly factor BamB